MKKIINGKVYDTDTAHDMGSDSYSNRRDFSYWSETLYQKRTGEFFLHGEGGPMSRYAETIGQNEWSGGEKIIPLSLTKAREWAEEHLTADEYEAAFGLPDEDAEDVALYVKVPAVLMARLRQRAATNCVSISSYIINMLEKNL